MSELQSDSTLLNATDGFSAAVPSATQRVVYVMEVADRPGIMHAIAAVFAHRGLSMQALVADAHRTPPRILVVFDGTPRQCRLVEQVLARLHDVHRIRSLAADAPEVRAFAVCHDKGGAALPELIGVSAQQLGDTWLLSGSYVAVDAALAQLRAADRIDEVSRSLVAL